ncbi:hypothetical protein F5I97DRAFT_1420910 [Phlebopus sp. FC_14]|nr:hypothetical protein F5I97DRAFT_1420910 [Phlebopus sp. FC_14]
MSSNHNLTGLLSFITKVWISFISVIPTPVLGQNQTLVLITKVRLFIFNPDQIVHLANVWNMSRLIANHTLSRYG